MTYFVSRQQYWGVEAEDGQYTVEIAGGGIDYSGSDMLVYQFAGEGQEYADPREAVKVARNILSMWRKKEPDKAKYMGIGAGYTGGMIVSLEHMTDEELDAWAEREWESLDKCNECGEIIEEVWTLEYDPDIHYCSSWCCDLAHEEQEYESILIQMDDRGVEDSDEIYVGEWGRIVVNPKEDSDRIWDLNYLGTAAYFRRQMERRGIVI